MHIELARTLTLNTHAFATLAMVGLIWFVQIVHYPLFAKVNAEGYTAYQHAHMSRTSLVVGPLMLVEAACVATILLAGWSTRPLAISGALLLALCWLSTFLIQVPRHESLARAFDPAVASSLVSSNWIRTIAWTFRGIIALLMLAPQRI